MCVYIYIYRWPIGTRVEHGGFIVFDLQFGGSGPTDRNSQTKP